MIVNKINCQDKNSDNSKICCYLQLFYQYTLVNKFVCVNDFKPDPFIDSYKQFLSIYMSNVPYTVDGNNFVNNQNIHILIMLLHESLLANIKSSVIDQHITTPYGKKTVNQILDHLLFTHIKKCCPYCKNIYEYITDSRLIIKIKLKSSKTNLNLSNLIEQYSKNIHHYDDASDTLPYRCTSCKSNAYKYDIVTTPKYFLIEIDRGDKKDVSTQVVNVDNTFTKFGKKYTLRGFIYYDSNKDKYIYYGCKNDKWHSYDYDMVTQISNTSDLNKYKNTSYIYLYVCNNKS